MGLWITLKKTWWLFQVRWPSATRKCESESHLCAGFCEESAFHAAELLLQRECCYIIWSCHDLRQHNHSFCICAMEPRLDRVIDSSFVENVSALKKLVVKDTNEQWCANGSARLSFSESESECGVRLWIVVEEVQVDYVPVSAATHNHPEPFRIRSSPWKGRRKITWSPVKLPRKMEVASSHTRSHNTESVFNWGLQFRYC